LYCTYSANVSVLNVDESDEIKCSQCGGEFVERLGQGLENFLTPQDESSATESPDDLSPSGSVPATNNNVSNPTDGSALIQSIVNRVLGLGVQTRPSQSTPILSILQQAASNTGRPVGIVVRQPSTPQEMEMIMSMMSSGGTALPGTSLGRLNRGSLETSGTGLGPRFGNGSSLDDLLHYILMNETSHSGSPPASQETIDKLVRRTHNVQELGECYISQEPFTENDVAICLPCGHSYKEESIIPWLRMHNTCPVCRISIANNQENS
jgi:hypothetical protein